MKLSSAQLSPAWLSSAKLSSAQLNAARLSQVQLSSAKLSSVQLNAAPISSRRKKIPLRLFSVLTEVKVERETLQWNQPPMESPGRQWPTEKLKLPAVSLFFVFFFMSLIPLPTCSNFHAALCTKLCRKSKALQIRS